MTVATGSELPNGILGCGDGPPSLVEIPREREVGECEPLCRQRCGMEFIAKSRDI